jgi:S1-C subfamily serine protease
MLQGCEAMGKAPYTGDPIQNIILIVLGVWVVIAFGLGISQARKEEKWEKENPEAAAKKKIKKSKEKKPESDQDNQQNIGMTGTAFFIDTKGHLITNFHVVANAGNRLKIFYEGEEFKTKIIAKDETLDLALLKTSIKSKNCIEISDKVIKKMQSIVAAGYPAMQLSDDLKFTSGIISSLKGIGNNSALIQIDAALNPGNSGGPIIDRKEGHLAGVAMARMEGGGYQNINYGIKASRVKEFIELNNITIPSQKSKNKKKRKDINLILENSTVLVFHK